MSVINKLNEKKVLVTGNTGFKGAWLSLLLKELGADVVGYSLSELRYPSLNQLIGNKIDTKIYYGDIRDYDFLFKTPNSRVY